MRAAWLLVALLGCKDKTETNPATTSSEPETALNAGEKPKLEVERDRFGNKPGKVDPKQVEARKQRLEKTLLRLDANKDNKVTVTELADSSIDYLKFEDPKAVDADGDSEISVDELDVAIDNRREQSRRRWKTEIGRPNER